MDEVLLTFHCVPHEADAIAGLLRTLTGQPVHVRAETVHGRDFGDADVTEQVMGTLSRMAVDVVAAHAQAEEIVAAVAASRRAHPVRWQMTAVLARGRIA